MMVFVKIISVTKILLEKCHITPCLDHTMTVGKRHSLFLHLSWFDVDLIIDSYHERNNTFELDISY